MYAKRNSKYCQSGSDLFTSGMFWLERKDYEAALEALVECHCLGYKIEEIEKIILENYYIPYRIQHRQNYLKNIKLFSEYPYFYGRHFPDFDELHYQFIPCSATRYFIYDLNNHTFSSDFDLKMNLDLSQCEPNDVIMINSEFRLNNILNCEEKTREPAPFLWAKTPQLLFYQDFNEFVQYLQVFDFSSALETERLVFIFGREELEQYYSEPQALFPKLLLNIWDGNDGTLRYITERYNLIRAEIHDLQDRVASYYSAISKKELLESIQGGKPRILFTTSRFTTALQYYIRDCALACDQLGIPNQVLIEKSNLHRVSVHTWLKVLNDFKPDIVFSLDHFKWEMPCLPDNIIHIGWVMDVLPNIASQESASKIGPLDFVLNAFVSNIDFLLDFSYPPEAIIEAPVVANPYIYKKYSLTQKEKEMYGANICAFSNSGNPQKGLDYLLNLISTSPNYDDLEKVFKLAYRDMYESFYQEKFIYSLENYRRFLFDHMKANGLSIPEETLAILAENWKQEIGYRILRSIPLEWLHEKGYDLKIWGSEWVDHPILSSYAQGVAANGEPLSRIINACQIVIGTNPGISTHPRVFESFLSNSFYLAYRIPEEDDWANIRKYLREDQEIVFAYSREDLYRKADYYLANEVVRKKIIRRARKKILKYLTYEELINRVLQEIALKLEEPRNGA